MNICCRKAINEPQKNINLAESNEEETSFCQFDLNIRNKLIKGRASIMHIHIFFPDIMTLIVIECVIYPEEREVNCVFLSFRIPIRDRIRLRGKNAENRM